ncbi:MAG: hypothetical protein JXB13_20270 [Phycisphaerae bacterium]|nr:hypothetical protein [Phycisphaerae bacterium]
MRLLLISDTHGKLGVVNDLAVRAQADAVIHAGNFGFHDDGSYERLSEREKVWTTLSQYTDLVRTVDNAGNDAKPRIFVSYVSPGKEPFVEIRGR